VALRRRSATVNGKTYNIDTATYITVFEDGPAITDPAGFSGAYWGLYQTRQGEVFKIRMNHDGEAILEFRPVTEAQAPA
jgi:hypothetical protein